MAATSPDRHKWSQAQTRRLIRFRADNEPRFLKSKASAKQQWQALISELELEGKVSSQQVSKKWENLKRRYKELKTGKSRAGTDAGEVTATNWQYYEDMHEVLGARPCMDPPLLVDAGAEEEDIPTTMDTVEPPPPPPKRRKSDPFMDFLEKESVKEEERHRETQHNTERFLSLVERFLEKIDKHREQKIDEHQCDTTYVASEMNWFQDRSDVTGTAELNAPGAEDSCDEQVYVPVIPQRSKMSELLLVCEEEELEPWQKLTSQIHLKEEEDDRELSIDQIDCKPDPASLQTHAPPPTVKEETPQPVFLNSQDFIVASPQLSSDTELISSPRNSLPIVTDGMQKVSQATVTPEAYGGIHTSEMQQISNNLLSSSSVQSPAVYATTSDQTNSQNLSVLLPFPFLTIFKLNSTSTTNKL